jgi:two-component system, response regulator YesN
MFRVLIVDDEIYAVKGLVDGVNWERLGVIQVFEAYNAREAKAILDNELIDLMICDIEMPEMNGLSLLEWVREMHPELDVVFLTCHAEFGYAKQALRLGSRDYLLKPVVFAELEEIVVKYLEEVQKKKYESKQLETFKKYYRLWHEKKPELIKSFWREMMNRSGQLKKETLRQAVRAYELPLSDKEKLLLILLSVEGWKKPLNATDEEIMGYALRKAAEELIISDQAGHVIEDESGNIIVIIYLQGTQGIDRDLWKRRCEEYIEVCKAYFYCYLSCYVGEVPSIAEVNLRYHELLEMEYRNVSRHNQVIFYNERIDDNCRSDQLSYLHWTESLESGDADRAGEFIEEIDEWVRQHQGTRGSLTKVYHALLQVIYYVLLRKGVSPDILYDQGLASDPSEVTRSSAGFKQWMERLIHAVISLAAMAEQRERQSSSIVIRIQTFIGENLHRELTRDELSGLVHLNSSYLSRLFRMETGMSLSEYILQERMKKASELLLSTDDSISSIAVTLGYDNFSYFAKLFKKVYQLTPQEYRKLYKLA